MIELKSYPAKNGDAFLLKASVSPFAMLVDGGYADTFHRYIKSDLDALASSGYTLDVVVATHVDADHISGLLTFFTLNGPAHAPAIIPVGEVLHNSLRSLVATTDRQTKISRDDLTLLRDIRLRGYPQPDKANVHAKEISARQGNSLAQLLRDGGYQWNTHVGTIPVGGDGLVDLCFAQGRITVLSPNKHRLVALKKWWVSEIRRLGFVSSLENLDDVFEHLCAHEVIDPGEQMLASSDANLETAYIPDNSITNGSSISFVIDVEDRRLLFLGDSWADDITAVLAANGPSIFDAVKISHHGSVRNTNIELLNLVDSPHFFISTNGDCHNHPDFAVLKAIVDRPSAFRRTLHFNYSTPASRQLRAYQSAACADFVIEEEITDWVAINGSNTV